MQYLRIFQLMKVTRRYFTSDKIKSKRGKDVINSSRFSHYSSISFLIPLINYPINYSSSNTGRVMGMGSSITDSGEGSLKSLEMHFSIGLHTTVCFRLEDTNDNSTQSNQSLLHTVTLSRIEHHHPVSSLPPPLSLLLSLPLYLSSS